MVGTATENVENVSSEEKVMTMRILRHVSLVALVLTVVVLATGCPSGVVFIPDSALDSAIRAEIGKPFGPLTEDDLLQVRVLDARNLGIRYLTGLEYCRNLEWLDLDTNKISSIKPLEQLGRPESPFDSPLGYLNLDSNEITDITPLAGLLNLYQISLFDNQIADLQALVANAAAGGLGPGDQLIVDSATLSEAALTIDVPTLVSYGVRVSLVVPAGGDGTAK